MIYNCVKIIQTMYTEILLNLFCFVNISTNISLACLLLEVFFVPLYSVTIREQLFNNGYVTYSLDVQNLAFFMQPLSVSVYEMHDKMYYKSMLSYFLYNDFAIHYF